MALSFTKITAVLRTYLVLPSSTVSSLPYNSSLTKSSLTCLVTRNYAADSGGGASKKGKVVAGAGGRIKEYPVEKDPNKLVTYCCGLNYFIEGEEVKLKPDNEYPDWLYDVYIGGARDLSELEPNSKEYWQRVRYLAIRRNVKLRKFRRQVLRQF